MSEKHNNFSGGLFIVGGDRENNFVYIGCSTKECETSLIKIDDIVDLNLSLRCKYCKKILVTKHNTKVIKNIRKINSKFANKICAEFLISIGYIWISDYAVFDDEKEKLGVAVYIKTPVSSSFFSNQMKLNYVKNKLVFMVPGQYEKDWTEAQLNKKINGLPNLHINNYIWNQIQPSTSTEHVFKAHKKIDTTVHTEEFLIKEFSFIGENDD